MLTFACLFSILTDRKNGASYSVLCVALWVDVVTFGAGYLVGAA